MGDFDKILDQAGKMDEAALKRNLENQRQILEFRSLNTYGKSKFFQTKDELSALAKTMKDTFESPEFGLFNKLADAKTEDDLPDGPDKLLFRLRQQLNAVYENNSRYSAVREGFSESELEETMSKDRKAFIDTLSAIQAADGILDELMTYDVSDSAEFDALYVAFNNVKKRYSDVAEGSLNIIHDSYDKGQKVYRIKGENPSTGVFFTNELNYEARRIAENKPPREDLKVEWIDETEPLFTHDPCPEDVMQGSVGDCYFVSALASIAAQNPDRIREMIKLRHMDAPDPADPSKTVTSTVAVVRLYTDKNEPVDVTVPYSTCWLTGKLEGKEFAEPIYASGATWVKIMEKALVASGLHTKLRTSFDAARKGGYRPDYDSISGGESHRVMQTLLGPEMAEKVDGEAVINKFEYLLPSKQDYPNMEKNEVDAQETLLKNVNREIKKISDDKLKVRTTIKNGLSKHFIVNEDKVAEAGGLDAAIEKALADPDAASVYFSKKTPEAPDLDKYFGKAKARSDRADGELAEAQKVLDKYDRAKRGIPEKFPLEYSDAELDSLAYIMGHYKAGHPLAAGTPVVDNSDDKKYEGLAAGIPFRHAYSITNVIEDPNGLVFIEVRNPHNLGTRQYDADGNRYYDPDRSKKGISRLELRDFCKTFDKVYAGGYDPLTTYAEKSADLKTAADLYGDALMSICNIIIRSDTYKKSPEYNSLRGEAKLLAAYLKDGNTDYNDFKGSLDRFFDKAEKYKAHRDAETSARTFNKESAANRYVAADAALAIRDLISANQQPGAVRKRADIYDILKQCTTVKEGDSIAKSSSVEVLQNIEYKAKLKQQKNLDKAMENARKVSEIAARQLAKGIREQNEKDIVTAISTMVYLDDVASSKDVSASAVTEAYSAKGITGGIDRLRSPVTEALRDVLKEKGPEKFLSDLAAEENPVKLIRDTWTKQLKARHPDSVKKAPEGPKML